MNWFDLFLWQKEKSYLSSYLNFKYSYYHANSFVCNVIKGLRYPCDICGFEATRRDKLKMHKERKHFNPQPRKKRVPKYEAGQIHYCDKCDYKSVKMRNLQVNISLKNVAFPPIGLLEIYHS